MMKYNIVHPVPVTHYVPYTILFTNVSFQIIFSVIFFYNSGEIKFNSKEAVSVKYTPVEI